MLTRLARGRAWRVASHCLLVVCQELRGTHSRYDPRYVHPTNAKRNDYRDPSHNRLDRFFTACENSTIGLKMFILLNLAYMWPGNNVNIVKRACFGFY